MNNIQKFQTWDEMIRKRKSDCLLQDVEKSGSLNVLAHYVLTLVKNSRESGEEIDQLSLELEKRAFFWIKRNSKAVDKTAKVISLPDGELLKVVRNARNRGVKLSKRILAAELAAFKRSIRH